MPTNFVTRTFKTMAEIVDFLNANNILSAQVVQIFQDVRDGQYVVVYTP